MKPIEEMSFEEFVTFGTAKILLGIVSPAGLRGSVWEVLNIFVQQWIPANGWKRSK